MTLLEKNAEKDQGAKGRCAELSSELKEVTKKYDKLLKFVFFFHSFSYSFLPLTLLSS